MGQTTTDELEEWRDTWFGDSCSWSGALRAATRQCLDHPLPAVLSWGPDSRLFYNGAYATLIGDKHPGARGRPGWESEPELWAVVGPLLHEVRTTGRQHRSERSPLTRDTTDGPRTGWYSWTYTPVWSDDTVEGVLSVIEDETDAELAGRHGEALRCAEAVATAADVRRALRHLVDTLGALPDVRFVVCHLRAGAGWQRLTHAGPGLPRPTASSLLDHAELAGGWPLPRAGEVTRRAPGGSRNALHDSWSATVGLDATTAVLTVGFSSEVGDRAGGEAFFDALVQRVRGICA